MDVPTIPARRIVIKNKSTAWFGTRYTMNIYRGCSHGCIYCDSRSECYGVQDFDTVRVKSDALAVIRNDLRSKTQSGVVATGSMSDPYNPFEKELQLTRHALELLDAYGFGAAVATKGTLITRDADILREIASHSPVLCKITVTTCDDALAAKLEPRAPSSSARLAAVEKLADTPDGVRRLVRAAYNAGARFVYPAFGVTLRQNQRAYFLDRLDELFPGAGLRARYVRQFGTQYECRSPRARELWQAFTGECRATGLLYGMQDIVAAYRQGYGSGQLSFL